MPKLLPVIHIESPDQALQNALVAKEADCDGCFLIDHGSDRRYLLESYAKVREALPDWWIGINDLSRVGPKVFDGLPAVDGIWVDSLGIDEPHQVFDAENLWTAKNKFNKDVMLFGGVAFKYQKKVQRLPEVALAAMQYCDVITTSGDGTGSAPSKEKIRTIRDTIGHKSLAVASGITLENVVDFADDVDYFLIATGISRSFTYLDPEKTKKMATLLHGEWKEIAAERIEKALNESLKLPLGEGMKLIEKADELIEKYSKKD